MSLQFMYTFIRPYKSAARMNDNENSSERTQAEEHINKL